MKQEFNHVPLHQTAEIARFLHNLTEQHTIFAFYGAMGAGKTTLISALNGLLNNDEEVVASPTFSLVNVYEGQTRVYHFDCYRLEKPEEALNAGLIDMIEDGTLCLIEWPEIIEQYLPANRVSVIISGSENPNERNFVINIPDHD